VELYVFLGLLLIFCSKTGLVVELTKIGLFNKQYFLNFSVIGLTDIDGFAKYRQAYIDKHYTPLFQEQPIDLTQD